RNIMNGQRPQTTLAERIRDLLATRKLTLYGIGTESRHLHPDEPSYHIPRNFYFQLESTHITPTLHQVSSFSELTGYRFADWLRIFGFSLDTISQVQASLPRPRTALLDGRVHESEVTIPWFRDRLRHRLTVPIAPLSRLLETAGQRPAFSLPF